MFYLKDSSLAKLLLTVFITFCAAQVCMGRTRDSRPSSSASSLETKLGQKADFIPQSSSALERLVEVAKHYRIPMGVEWIEQRAPEAQPLSLQPGATVRDLIEAVIPPAYQLSVEHGVLNVGQPVTVNDPKNPLNIRIPRFYVENRNLKQAQALLRVKLEMALYPEEYKEGYISDSGSGSPGDAKKFSLSGQDLTVREILNKITEADGDSLWLVRLRYEPAKEGELPTLKNVRLGERQSTGLSGEDARTSSDRRKDPIQEENEFRWEFIPFKESPINTDYRIFYPSKTSP
jgi:hypothetical protein